MKPRYVWLMLSLLVIGCSDSSKPTPKIAEDQRNVLDKAKTVDTTVQQSADEIRQQVDKQAE